ECARYVNDDDRRRFVAKQWGAAVDDGLDVYIVCSLLGGTGSGSFIDAAYLARNVARQFHSQAQTLGFLIIGGGSSVDSANLANCYGALKELSYYSTGARRFNETHSSAFDAQYPQFNRRIESKADLPFDFCYLATNFNEQQAQFSKAALFELVAQNIFLEFTPGVAASKRAIRINIAEHGYRDPDGRLGQAQSFLSFGLATIEFPALRIEDCLAYRLAGEAMDYFSFRNAQPDSDLTQQVDRDIRDWGFDPDRLIKAQISDDSGRTLLKAAAELKNEKQTEMQKYLPRQQRDQLLVYLNNHLDNARDDVRVTRDRKTCGGAIRQIEKKAERLLGEAIGNLRRRVAERISNPVIGVKNTLEYLNVFEGRLKSFEKNYRAAENQQQKNAAQIAERETKAIARVGANKHDATDGEMRTLVNDALSASLEFSQSVIQEYANRQARLTLAGETDEQGRTGECLLKEIKRLENQIAEFTSRLADFSNEFVGRRERDENGRETWSGGKYAELRRNLTVGAYNSDVLVDPDEIDTHYQDCAASPAKEYVGLKEEIERRLGKDGESVFRLVLEQPEQVKNISVEAARRRFLGVRNISIANKLAQLPQAEVDRRVQEAARRSHVLLRFDNDSLSAAGDTPGSRLTSHNPGFHSIAMLATCHPSEDEEVNLEPAPGRQPSKLARAFHSQVAGIQHEKALPDRYRLVFVREKGVFPLYCIADLKDLRDSYQNEMRQHNAKPRETDHRVDFPDLFPLDPRMEKMPARVRRALTLGRAFKFVRDDRDARTEEPALIYSFRNEHGRLNEIILGRDSDDAARAMAERQINKEVHRERTGEETWLEHLEKTIEQEGRKPVRLSEKEALWMRLQEHLSGLKRDLPDGERDHSYQREAEIIEEFCDGRGLRPPGDRADPKRETSPIAPPTQPFDYAAPTQTLGADELSFRERVTVKLRRSASGSLPPDEITKLMQEAIEDYHLTPGAAKQIIDQAQRQPVTAAEPDARSVEKYRELCRDILEGDAGFDESRAMLEDKRRRLNLTQAQARAIEKQVEDQVWREQKPVYLKEVK
ncbi:MAG: tubulin-like doman-containing protein, partial [Blastocatellia bacterium]